jgi:multiple sugar transport system permease protein
MSLAGSRLLRPSEVAVWPLLRKPYRLRRLLGDAAALAVGFVLLIWSLLPTYNMLLIALDAEGDTEYAGIVWPAEPTLDSFRVVMTGDYWYLEHFWHKFANSLFIALATMALTMMIGSLASFALGRMRLVRGWLLGNFPVATYAVPASFLVMPFYRIMREYGLSDSLWSVIAADVTFATPYAILILQQYAKLIPLELDEAAQIDGASPLVVYKSIYLPLMAPALAAVGTFALLLAWNEYLYQYLLLTSDRNMTVAVAIAQFFDADEAPWNYMMATAIVYALPPVVIFFALRRWLIAGMALGVRQRQPAGRRFRA